MKLTIFAGDIADAPAEAICTSTNPRLSLMMGTGGSIRERGGYEILRACEAILSSSRRTVLPVGSVFITTAGSLPAKRILHCIASDNAHRSSDDIVASCVRNALLAADSEGCRSVAMPVFGTGHAGLNFDRVLRLIRSTIDGAATNVVRVVIVVKTAELAERTKTVFPEADVIVQVMEEDEYERLPW